ncbi:V-type ATP synthase alpha chain [uncultured archaeon]|nr:V-type ATP synthase alpha chain [uncultured archaeon]
MGKLIRISGPVVEADGMAGTVMYEVVKVGKEGLMGEVIKIVQDRAIIQVYEDTAGLVPGEPVEGTGLPLSVELGPGLLPSIYDGIQRPLESIAEKTGSLFLPRGVNVAPLDHSKKWEFKAVKKAGDKVKKGDVLGTVQETDLIAHKILSPHDGTLKTIHSGKFTLDDTVAVIDQAGKSSNVTMVVRQPVRKARESAEKLNPTIPLITGQRVVDMFFPVAKGGTCAIPGPFGSGKTVTQHQFAKWSDTQIVVYIGCGERGNEMTEVLTEFPHLVDPKSGKPLMQRTILFANTSNMPVAAREASIYTGITIAEYYRDMGYDVSLMADSTSRWAEAMREIGGRLEEMPGEEGYPAYLARRLAEFYERAGRVRTLGSDERYGSITVIGAVSPPGGDINEPVSQNTLRVTKVYLALEAALAQRRHFPAFNWLRSYSLYTDSLDPWFSQSISADWPKQRAEAMGLLQKEAELQEIVQLVGPDALPEKEQLVLATTRSLREDFLQQSAFHDIDTYSSMRKQYLMLRNILAFHARATAALDLGVQLKRVLAMPIRNNLGRMKEVAEGHLSTLEGLQGEIDKAFDELSRKQ